VELLDPDVAGRLLEEPVVVLPLVELEGFVVELLEEVLPLVEVAGFVVVLEELDLVEEDVLEDDLDVEDELLVLVDGLLLVFANAT
jgi:hypothetical protein